MGRPTTKLVTVGMKFGKLAVVEKITINRRTNWKVICDCGQEKIMRTEHLSSGRAKGCGCKRYNRLNLDHGHASHRAIGRKQTPTYKSWADARENARKHPELEFHEPWNNFSVFLQDMGERQDWECLGRKEFEEGYYPDNCFWEDKTENAKRKGFYSNSKSR